MPALVTTGYIERGRLTVRSWNRLQDVITRARDGDVQITIERLRATRSQQQNRWYWGFLVAAIADHTGYTPEEIHQILKAKFIPKTVALADGNGEVIDEFVIGGTTTTLDTEQFSAYCERVREWAAADLGVVIPDPE